MKKAVFLFCLFASMMSVNAQEQNRPTGLLGATFGDPVEKVKQIISSKDGFSFVEEASNMNLLAYTGSFGGDAGLIITFEFIDSMLFQVQVIYRYENNTMITKYERIKEMLIEKYGDPIKNVFEVPDFYKDDPEPAIENHRATVACLWSFKNGNNIILYCSSDAIRLFYYDEALKEKNDTRENMNNLKDF